MINIVVEAEVHCLLRHRRRDYIPAGTPVTDMVKRGNHPGKIVGLGIRCRYSREKSDLGRYCG
jgi:hypothetical protein